VDATKSLLTMRIRILVLHTVFQSTPSSLATWGRASRPAGHAVSQIGVQAGEAELGEALVSGTAALAGAADLPWGAVDAGLVE
jgi:hypothetical protein